MAPRMWRQPWWPPREREAAWRAGWRGGGASTATPDALRLAFYSFATTAPTCAGTLHPGSTCMIPLLKGERTGERAVNWRKICQALPNKLNPAVLLFTIGCIIFSLDGASYISENGVA